MLELRCPNCDRANAVTEGAVLDRVRCAECEKDLEEHCQVRYLVSDTGREHAPQLHRDLVTSAAAGTLTPDMLLSEEGGPWFRAGERSDLFPRRRRVVSRGPRRTPNPRLRVPPGPVKVMAVLDVVAGVLLLLLALLAFAILSSFGAMGAGLPVVLIIALLGVGHLNLAGGLRRRSRAARTIQLVLAGLGGVGLLLLLGDGLPGGFVLVGGGLVAIPFLLLLGDETRAWFEGRDASA